MTDQDQRFQHRWQFRRTEIDVDSSSDDDHSRPSSASEPKVVKQNLVPCPNPEEDANQTMHSPTSYAKEEKEIRSSLKESDSKPKQSRKTHERKARTRTKKETSNNEPADGVLCDLRGHMVSLVDELKNARKDMLEWMDNELKSSAKAGNVSAKPTVTKRGQRQNTTRSKTPRTTNANNRRKKKMTQNGEGEPSGKKSSTNNEEVVIPTKETEKVVIDTLPVENTEKQKGKRPRLSAKKQKTTVVEADQQSNTTVVAAAADNYLTLPSILPQKQAENSEQNPLNDGNEIDGEKRNTLNSGGSSSSYQLNFDPRAHQKDVVFAQNSMPRNVNNYEQNTGNTMGSGNGNGNGNGNGFPFPLVPQGSNSGIGMPNIPSQFALQYLSTQGNRISGIYRDHPGFPNGNHAFMGSYGGLNQQLTYNFQQGEVMALQCPDIRRAAFNQGNLANQ